MSLNWTSYVVSLGNLLVVATTDAGFLTALPNIIDDAEQRIFRELDLLNTMALATATLNTGTRVLNLPSSKGTFIVVERINVITPATATVADLGTRNPLTPVSHEYLDFTWPSQSGSSVPQYFAPFTQSTFILGPWPDQAYPIEVEGTIRPLAISSTNQTTLLSVYFPDLFIAGSMVFGAAYQKNFGAASDDPKAAVTWEGHYQTLKASADVEEMRKKFVGAGWSSKQPAPLATPPRT